MLDCVNFPRPDFRREDWLSLDGVWQFAFGSEAIPDGHFPVFNRSILVPFCFESEQSGIGLWQDESSVWYQRTFHITRAQAQGAILFKAGAIDAEAEVWINQHFAGSHTGGYTPLALEISQWIRPGENTVVIRARDSLRLDQPRGKQSWLGRRFECWYTPCTGIWQSVWLEFTACAYLEKILITPDYDHLLATCDLYTSEMKNGRAEIIASLDVSDDSEILAQSTARIEQGHGRAVLAFPDTFPDRISWSPQHPNLIKVKVSLFDESGSIALGEPVHPDQVTTYFGMRKISVHGNQILLNNKPLFQRLVLDQGYWRESLLTPPSEQAIIKDIELTRAMGFNGVRKHQKIEDPRYYHWADRLGLLVWGELPSHYLFNHQAIESTSRTLLEFIQRDYNHPCLITWVTQNESWGARNIYSHSQQQDFSRALYYWVRTLDPSRLVSSNDGWEQTESSDICTIHDYDLVPDTLDKYTDIQQALEQGASGRMTYCESIPVQGKPVILSEFGGVAFEDSCEEHWGYSGKVPDEVAFVQRIQPVTEFLTENRHFAGYCYTQLTDVEQEVNGLLDMDRNPKIPLAHLRKLFTRQPGKPVHDH